MMMRRVCDYTGGRVPKWLQAVRGIRRSGEEEEAPCCDINCEDGEQYYNVLCAWDVAWQDVPKAQFLKAWFRLRSEKRRRLLLHQQQTRPQQSYSVELDEDRWMEYMLQRDDANMLSAATTLAPLLQQKEESGCSNNNNSNISNSNISNSNISNSNISTAADTPPATANNGADVWDTPAPTTDVAATPAAVYQLHPPRPPLLFLRPDEHIRYGAVKCLQLWARQRGWPVDGNWSRYAKEYWPTIKACDAAAASNQLAMLQLLHEHGIPWDADTCECAARNGSLECLQYLRKNGCPWSADTCTAAAEHGRLDCLAFAHEHGCPWDVHGFTCARAAENGHLACLVYLHAHGCPWDKGSVSWAAMNGRLECLKFLHAHGCPYNARSCAYAAYGGSLACLRYLREECACPWDERVSAYAASGATEAHLECVRYARQHGCPMHKERPPPPPATP